MIAPALPDNTKDTHLWTDPGSRDQVLIEVELFLPVLHRTKRMNGWCHKQKRLHNCLN